MKKYYTKESVVKKFNTMREVCKLYEEELNDEVKMIDDCNFKDEIERVTFDYVAYELKAIDPAIYAMYADDNGISTLIFDVCLSDTVNFNEVVDDKVVERVALYANATIIYHEEIDPDEFNAALPDYGYDEEVVDKIIENFLVMDNKKIVLGYLLVEHSGIIIQTNDEGCCNVSCIDLNILNTLVK